MTTGPQPGNDADGRRVDAGGSPGRGWAPMARDLATVARILDDLPYPAHLCAVDPGRTYPWVAANAAALEALGRTRDQVVGRPLAEVVRDQAAAHLMARRHGEVAAGLDLAMFELVVDGAGGRRRYDTTLVPIRDGGACSHVFSVWNDATLGRETGERLRAAAESGDKGFAILESVRDDDGHVVDFRFVYANRNSRQRLTLEGAPVIGQRLSEVVPVPAMRDAMKRYATVVSTDEPLEMEFEEDLPHRRGRWLNQHIVRVGDGIAITTYDVSSRKRAEHEVARRTEVERLVAGIARDLNATSAEHLDSTIVDALGRMAQFVEAAASGLHAFSPDGHSYTRTHEWPQRSGQRRMPARVPAAPWLDELARASDGVSIHSPADAPPNEGAEIRRALEELGVRGVAILPVRSQGRPQGFISLTWTSEPDPAHESVLPALAVLGDVMAATLERSEAERALRARTEAETLLTDISRGLLPLPPDQVDDAVVAALGRVAAFLGADSGTLGRFAADGALVRELNWSASERSGLPEVIPRSRLPWLLGALSERETVFVPDLEELGPEADGDHELLGAIGVRALAAFPLRMSDRLVGLVGFGWRDRAPGAVEASLEGLHVLGDVLVAALERRSAEEALRTSEQRFRALVQHTSDVITVLDAEGWIVYHSPAATQFGWGGNELLGTLAFDLIHPDDRTRVEERFYGGLEHQANQPVEFRLRGGDGTWHHVEAVGNNLLDDPAVHGVVLTTRDITERKQSEEKLRAREQRFRALVQSTSDIITVMDADGRLSFVSPAVTRVLGWEPDDSQGRFDPLELVHPDDREHVAVTYAESIDGRPVEYRMLHADGTWRYMESVGTNLLDDPAVRGVVVNTRDVTDRKEAEAARARHSEAERVISEISRRLLTATEHDVDAVIEEGLGRVATFVGAMGAGLLQYSDDARFTNRSHAWTVDDGEQLRALPARMPTVAAVVDALRNVDHLVIDLTDVPDDGAGWTPRLAAAGVRVIGQLPVRSGGNLTGFLLLAWAEPVAPEVETVLPTLRVLADVFVAAIERTQTEARRRESEARYRGVVEGGPDLTFRIRRDGTYLDAHGHPDRMLVPPEETIGRNIYDIRPREYADALMHNIATALDTGELQTFEHDLEVHGELRSFEIRIVPVAPDEALDIVRDVTERVESELALRRSEERFRALVQNTSDMITVLDADGSVEYTSPASAAALGWKTAARQGGFAWDLVHPDDRERIQRTFTEAVARPGTTETVLLRLRHRDGSWRTIEAVGTNLFHDPAVRGFVINGRDVTERVRLEEQLLQAQKMEAVGQLAGGIAHDFNNLLTAITGYVTLLLDDVPAPDPMHDDLVEIDSAAKRAAALVDQLLAFSRRTMVQPTIIDLNEVVESMRSLMQRLLTVDIQLGSELAPTLPGIRADRNQVERVIMNLVVNARDAMPAGGPLVIETSIEDVDARRAAEHFDLAPGRYVCLAVTDRGTGMDPATQARIFEPFFSTKEVGQGTGLGLATVYGIVNQAGGHVTVDSEPGQGTTFRVYLPAVSTAEPSQPSDVERGDPVPGRGHETVLVVDDEVAVRSLAAEVLRRSGYDVLVAAGGPEALEIAKERTDPIDLLLADVVLPGVRGVTVADEVTARHPDARVLFMSGYTESAVVRGGELTRDIEFLPKPFRPDDLTRRVREVLDRAQLST